jgi:hypothetical protein
MCPVTKFIVLCYLEMSFPFLTVIGALGFLAILHTTSRLDQALRKAGAAVPEAPCGKLSITDKGHRRILRRLKMFSLSCAAILAVMSLLGGYLTYRQYREWREESRRPWQKHVAEGNFVDYNFEVGVSYGFIGLDRDELECVRTGREGVQVTEVLAGSPAAKGGLEARDIIDEVWTGNGWAKATMNALSSNVARQNNCRLRVIRQGVPGTPYITIDRREFRGHHT